MLIGNEWKIETERLNITLSRFKTMRPRRGKPVSEGWVTVGFYSSVVEALNALVEFGVKETELKDLQTVVTKIDELKEMITEAVKQ